MGKPHGRLCSRGHDDRVTSGANAGKCNTCRLTSRAKREGKAPPPVNMPSRGPLLAKCPACPWNTGRRIKPRTEAIRLLTAHYATFHR